MAALVSQRRVRTAHEYLSSRIDALEQRLILRCSKQAINLGVLLGCNLEVGAPDDSHVERRVEARNLLVNKGQSTLYGLDAQSLPVTIRRSTTYNRLSGKRALRQLQAGARHEDQGPV